MITLPQLLKVMLDNKASDMHISAGSAPSFRVFGSITRAKVEPFTGSETKELCYSVLTETQKAILEEKRQIDLSFGIRDLARFRANIFYQRGTLSGAFRHIPFEIPKLKNLGFPPAVNDLILKPKGLILITGATGSGKSTTLASLINELNEKERLHVITIEDPIEYIHSHGRCLINQREIGPDALSYADAVKAALREDPDVVLIGEMRDRETIETALTLAETGHLVFSTLHTNSAAQTINRIVQSFPADHQDQVRMQLSMVLEGVLSQVLIERTDKKGRALAMELLLPNNSIRNLIRENKIFQIASSMRVGQDVSGMITLNQSLAYLVNRGIIPLEKAFEVTPDVDELSKAVADAERRAG
jgi:twitching motility protein PilT